MAAEPVYRPYKTVEEFVEDWKKHHHLIEKNSNMLESVMSVLPATLAIIVHNVPYGIGTLLEHFTWDNGSPCGILVEE